MPAGSTAEKRSMAAHLPELGAGRSPGLDPRRLPRSRILSGARGPRSRLKPLLLRTGLPCSSKKADAAPKFLNPYTRAMLRKSDDFCGEEQRRTMERGLSSLVVHISPSIYYLSSYISFHIPQIIRTTIPYFIAFFLIVYFFSFFI
jgi:hypothetical protein